MTYKQKVSAYKNYILQKLEENDWHAIIDAAFDLRILEASQKELQDEEEKVEKVEKDRLSKVEDY